MSDSQQYDEWTQAATSGTYTPLQSERLLEMFAWTSRYGSPNCWSGTTGEAATMLRELLRERIMLAEENERLKDELRDVPGATDEV